VNRVRYVGAVILTALILIFALQNLEGVHVDLLFWEVSASVALIALGPFLVGLVVGSAATFIRARRARAKEIKASKEVDQLIAEEKPGSGGAPGGPSESAPQ
jgi:uncharacterized integral membrane protein